MTRDGSVDHLDILLVEDNPGDVRLIREALGESSVESSLTTVTNGEEALDYLRRGNEDESEARPDLTILDLNVPKVHGRRVLERIRGDSKLRSMPVIILSSSGARDDIHETYELGANGYFVKPVDPNELFSLVRTVEESLAASGRLPLGEYADIDGAT